MVRVSTFFVIAFVAGQARAEGPAPSGISRGSERAQGEPTISSHPDADPDSMKRDEASQRFQKGLAFYQEGEPKLALVEFEKAYELVPDYRVLYNLALVAMQIGQFAKARMALEDYLQEGAENVDAGRRLDIERDLEMLRARTASLRVETIPSGATVLVDDIPLGESPLETAVVLDVGQHRVSFRKDGYEQKAERVTLAGGEERQLRTELKPVTPKVVTIREPVAVPVGPVRSGPSTAAWVSWGATAALATGALITGIYAIGQANSFEAMKQTPDPDRATLEQLSSSASSALLATDVLLVGTGVALGTSVYFTFWGPKRREKEVATHAGSLRFGVVPSGVRFSGEF